jgi:spermidine synthase
MSTPLPDSNSGRLRPFLPVLLLLFMGSGCAALIYEIVWLQLLQLAVGSSAVSLGVLLGTYMGGMCLGSLLLPRFVSASQHPLRVYARLELGIGIMAIVVLFLIPMLDSVYAAIASHGLQGVFLRAVVAAICLLPPTILMGASLPAVARWVEATPQGVSWLGFLYGGNIAGAVFGCLLAGFYLLRVYDMAIATYIAVLINFAVALISFALAKRTPFYKPAPVSDVVSMHAGIPPGPSSGPWDVYITIALSGMCALGAEVIWTRLLSVMIGATVYTFSIILAVFLIGLGLGSGAGSILARSGSRAALGWCQMALAGAIAWAAYALSDSIPYWPINPMLSPGPWFNFQIDLVRCLWAILPSAILWGASFPLALAAAASSSHGGAEQDPGKLVGRTYAANTVGAILGSIAFSMLLIPWIGSQNSQRLLIALAVCAALLMLLRNMTLQRAVALGVATAAVAFLAFKVDEVPWMAIGYGRRMLTVTDAGKPLFRGEGMNSSVIVSQLPSGQIYFHVSGKVEASTEPFDMRLQRMLGHLPALIHPHPQSVLIVGFGAGVTAGTFAVYSEIKRIVICEIEKIIPPATSRYFGAENYHVLTDPRTEMHYDDARHFVLTTGDKFDIITSDPIHPWVKGTATLYSKEYFEVCKQHLNPGGIVTQWVPLYESEPDTVMSEFATFFSVFPNGTVWANDINGEGYDVVLLGRNGDEPIDVDQMTRRFTGPVAESLKQVNINSVSQLLATYAGRASDLRPWIAGAHVNTDMDLRLQYMAGAPVSARLGRSETRFAVACGRVDYRRVWPMGRSVVDHIPSPQQQLLGIDADSGAGAARTSKTPPPQPPRTRPGFALGERVVTAMSRLAC